jgi:hypothetical protein
MCGRFSDDFLGIKPQEEGSFACLAVYRDGIKRSP